MPAEKIESTGKDTQKFEQPISSAAGEKSEVELAAAAAKSISSPVDTAKAERSTGPTKSITFTGENNRFRSVMAFGRNWDKGKVYEIPADEVAEMLQNPDFVEVK